MAYVFERLLAPATRTSMAANIWSWEWREIHINKHKYILLAIGRQLYIWNKVHDEIKQFNLFTMLVCCKQNAEQSHYELSHNFQTNSLHLTINISFVLINLPKQLQEYVIELQVMQADRHFTFKPRFNWKRLRLVAFNMPEVLNQRRGARMIEKNRWRKRVPWTTLKRLETSKESGGGRRFLRVLSASSKLDGNPPMQRKWESLPLIQLRRKER